MAQLTEIHERLQAMLRQIKEDKEEQERREGMDEEEEGEEVEASSRREGVSGANTPARPNTHLTAKTDSEGGKTPSMIEKTGTPGPSGLSQEVDIVITDAPPVEEDKMDTT